MAKFKSLEYFRVPSRSLFTKITDEEESVGWGEASLEGHTQAVEGSLDAYSQQIVGLEADEIEHIWQMIYRFEFYRGGPVMMSALAGVDIALWDLKARKLGMPIYELLGGKVRSKLKVYAWIGGDRPDDVEVKARQAQGFRAVKMNATEDIGWLETPSVLQGCVKRLRVVKSLCMIAGIDFHGRMHKPMAKQLAHLLEPHQPIFIEEPLLSEHIEVIKALSQQTSNPIGLGERLHSLSPDICHVGGISEIRRITNMCEAYDVDLAPHCPLGPIALAACIQVDSSVANFAIQEMSLGIHYNARSEDLTSYTKNPEVWNVTDGYIDPITGPGLWIDKMRSGLDGCQPQ